jgi:ATP-dependent Lon protease
MDKESNNLPGVPVDVSVGGQGRPEDGSPYERSFNLPEVLPILSVKDMSMFPRMVLPMLIGDVRHQILVDDVLAEDKLIGLVALRGDLKGQPVTSTEQLHEIGVAALVLKMVRSEEGTRLIAQGMARFRLMHIVQTQPYLKFLVQPVTDIVSDDLETMALISNLRNLFRRVVELAPHLPDELQSLVASVDDPGALCDMVASALNLNPEERQSIVEALKVKKRLRRITNLLNREIQVLELGSKIQKQVKNGLDKTQKDYYLRQQLKAIQKELGEAEEEPGAGEVENLRKKLKKKPLPNQVCAEATRELNRLSRMHPSSSEYNVITTYLDWILTLPWLEETADDIDIKQARKILEEDHYGLEKVKRRILEYLAVRKLNPQMKGLILCFVGPPGVGKTSLGRSIAQAMGRKFARISLGGVRDEAELRGHRRTYVGALPGHIVQSLRRVGFKNPVFMLDEVDKVGGIDFRGDLSSALLEVLDPEQNNSFRDHYLDLPIDLSKVVFITTANVLDTIPQPLRDRMEVLELPGYTAEDKLKIAKRYLVPRQRKEHGLNPRQISINDAAIRLLIASYTREAGLRNLEREIGSLCRWVARKIAEGEAEKVVVTRKEVAEVLGPERFTPEVALRTAVPGVATGLAWTAAGGDILFVEATAMPGKGHLSLTGQLGDVMKESAQAAVSLVRANAQKLGVDPTFFSSNDLHIHVPAGAIPKDGPSAGVTLFTALLSLLTGRPARHDLAMTGEITLRGLVLSIGGVKEKVLAAHRAGIHTVMLPMRNQRDLVDVPANIKKHMKFIFAERVDDVASHALSPAKPRANTVSKAAVKPAPKAPPTRPRAARPVLKKAKTKPAAKPAAPDKVTKKPAPKAAAKTPAKPKPVEPNAGKAGKPKK